MVWSYSGPWATAPADPVLPRPRHAASCKRRARVLRIGSCRTFPNDERPRCVVTPGADGGYADFRGPEDPSASLAHLGPGSGRSLRNTDETWTTPTLEGWDIYQRSLEIFRLSQEYISLLTFGWPKLVNKAVAVIPENQKSNSASTPGPSNISRLDGYK